MNKAILSGNLGQDVQVHEFSGGGKLGKVSLATTEKWTDRQTGELKKATEWHNVTLDGKRFERVFPYLTKGTSILVEGKIQRRSWEKDGTTHYSTEIRASSVELLSRAPQGTQNAGDEFLANKGPAKGQPLPEPNDDDLPF